MCHNIKIKYNSRTYFCRKKTLFKMKKQINFNYEKKNVYNKCFSKELL